MTETEPAQLPVVPSSIRDAALAELARLSSFVEALPLEDWKKPSAASGWSMGDVVTHLDLALGIYVRLLVSALSGGGSGSVWRTLGKVSEKVAPASMTIFDAVNSAIPKLIDRSLAPEVVRGQFAAASRKVQARLEGIAPGDYTRPVYYMGGPYPISFFLAWIVNELAMHGWDMESQLKPDAVLSPEARAVLPWFYWSATPLMLHLPKGSSGTVQVDVEDPDAAMWWRFGEGKPEQGTGTAANADATIRGGSGVYLLTLAGRISPDAALRSTSLNLEGNESLARVLLGNWKLL